MLAVDQADLDPVNGFELPITAWLYADLEGDVTSIAWYDSTNQPHTLARVIDINGAVTRDTSTDAENRLAQVPYFWHDLQHDEHAGVYLTPESAIPVSSLIASPRNSTEVSLFAFLGDEVSSVIASVRDKAYQGIADVFGEENALAYAHYFDPQSSLNEGGVVNTMIAYYQTQAWIVAGVAGGAAFGGGTSLAIAGSFAGTAAGITSSLASNPSGGLGSIAFAGSTGGLFGGLNPYGAFGSLAGQAILGSGAYVAGYDSQTISRAILVGDLVGGIAGGGIGDARKVARHSGRLAGLHHGRRYASVDAGGAIIGGGIGFAATGTFDGALLGANLGSGVGGAAASRFVKCFVAGHAGPRSGRRFDRWPGGCDGFYRRRPTCGGRIGNRWRRVRAGDKWSASASWSPAQWLR